MADDKTLTLTDHELARQLAGEIIKAARSVAQSLGVEDAATPAALIEAAAGYSSSVMTHLIAETVPEAELMLNMLEGPTEKIMDTMFALGMLVGYRAVTQKVN